MPGRPWASAAGTRYGRSASSAVAGLSGVLMLPLIVLPGRVLVMVHGQLTCTATSDDAVRASLPCSHRFRVCEAAREPPLSQLFHLPCRATSCIRCLSGPCGTAAASAESNQQHPSCKSPISPTIHYRKIRLHISCGLTIFIRAFGNRVAPVLVKKQSISVLPTMASK